MDDYFQKYLSEVEWLFQEDKYDPSLQPINESLFALGNGYIGSRGIYEEASVNSTPGTFFAGIFDHAASKVAELINAPNLFHFSVISKNNKLTLEDANFVTNQRTLDLKKGLLSRQTVFKMAQGNRIDYQSMRFLSSHNLNLAAMQVVLTPLDVSEEFTIDASINISIKNKGIILEKDVQTFNIFDVEKKDGLHYLSVESLDCQNEIGYAQQLFLTVDGEPRSISETNIFDIHLSKGQTAIITRIITFDTAGNTADRQKLKSTTITTLQNAIKKGFNQLLTDHIQIFEKKWVNFDIQIVGDTDIQSVLRFNLYHLLIAAHPEVKDVSIGAKLLTGEGYKGHSFWETELLFVPSALFYDPLIARHLLEYRFKRLPAALELAHKRGFKGALFPWESAESGKDETPPWSEDLDATLKIVHTGKQSLHINVAIFYAIYHYFFATDDIEFMLQMGLTLSIQMARFWKSKAVYNKQHDLYKIKEVMGPDEFHDNVNNNAYTNKLVSWSLEKTLELIELFLSEYPTETTKILKDNKFYAKEKQKLIKISHRLHFPAHEKIILQFDDFLSLKNVRLPNLDVFGLPTFPPDLLLIDLNKTQLIKQADVVLLLFLLPTLFDRKTAESNFHFYDARSLHKSSWSAPIYAGVASQLNFDEKAYRYFNISLNTDKKNIFGNTHLGMHMPGVAGSWVALVYGFCGIRIEERQLSINPQLPPNLHNVSLQFAYLDFNFHVSITQETIKLQIMHADRAWLTLQPLRTPKQQARVQIGVNSMDLVPNKEYIIKYRTLDAGHLPHSGGEVR
ncbi:MAG: glycoside hydrolase family 65 protein [Gammaproteobacteria bacterium]|nr:glycoside hydrolase family 65 protein [Gammaproteobacteria bacterium]